MKYYGSLNNRLEENNQFCDEIKVGTGVTEYHWSDRDAYEVIAVKDQKHVTIRKYDHEHVGDGFDNEWKLISNPDNPEIELAKRGNYWYRVKTFTSDILDKYEQGSHDEVMVRLGLAHNGVSVTDLRLKGKITRYSKMNISFGVADYYYDYSF